MSFGAPALLWGIAGAALPVLLHLLRHRPPQPVEFPAIVLLGDGLRAARIRRHIRTWLLLLVRTLLVAATALALARPFTKELLTVPAGARQQQAAVILLDDSLSMRARVRSESLAAAARARVEALLTALPAEAPTALLTTSGASAEVAYLCEDRSSLRRALAHLSPTFRAGATENALRRAVALLERAPAGLPKAIYLVTDATRASGPTSAVPLPQEIALRLVRIAQPPLPNLAVVDARAESLPATSAGSPLTVRVSLLRTGGPPHTVRVRLVLTAGSARLSRRTLSLARGARKTVRLRVPRHRLPKSHDFGRVRLEVPGASSGDSVNALLEDDVRIVPLGLGPRLRLVLVDGDPREVRHEDELFYLESAIRSLDPRAGRDLRVVSPGDLATLALDDVHLVVLANVGRLPPGGAPRLIRYVRGGGALWIALGDQVRPAVPTLAQVPPQGAPAGDHGDLPDALHALSDILPAQLRAVWSRGRDPMARPNAGGSRIAAAAHLSLAEAAPPFRDLLSDPAVRSASRQVRVFRYGLLQDIRGRVLLRLSTGAPLLVERRAGAGTVWLFGTTLDRDWTDLVHQPLFLPLLRRALEALTRRLRPDAAGRVVRVGETRWLRGLPGDLLEVRGPSGLRWNLHLPRDAGRVAFHHTDRPGLYRVSSKPVQQAGGTRTPLAGRPLPEQAFGVVLDPAESDLRPTRTLRPQPGHLGPVQGRETVARKRDRTLPIALLCLLLVLMETALAGRLTRRRRAPPVTAPR